LDQAASSLPKWSMMSLSPGCRPSDRADHFQEAGADLPQHVVGRVVGDLTTAGVGGFVAPPDVDLRLDGVGIALLDRRLEAWP